MSIFIITFINRISGDSGSLAIRARGETDTKKKHTIERKTGQNRENLGGTKGVIW